MHFDSLVPSKLLVLSHFYVLNGSDIFPKVEYRLYNNHVECIYLY